jgi:acetyl-CoA synthetase
MGKPAGFDNPPVWPNNTAMTVPRLTEFTGYADAHRNFSSAALWDLFDGDRSRLNIAHECVDRWAADPARVAIRLVYTDGRYEAITFRALAVLSSRFGHWLRARGITPGDRVAIMLEPSPAFYAALFGAMRMGAVAVPLFTLFGPDGVRLRVDDCQPRLLLTNAAKAAETGPIEGVDTVIADAAFLSGLARFPDHLAPDTEADAMAMYQYTSGTTRNLPEAIRHTHRAIVVVANAALYGTGIRPGDRYFCPSSPAWGHGLWHGTLAPLGLGVETGTFSGKFDAAILLRALADFRVTNFAASATHYRLMRQAGVAERYRYFIDKMSFTGEPVDSTTLEFAQAAFGTRLCSMYGTTEVGVVLADFPGASDYVPRPGALGKPVPGATVAVLGPDGVPAPPGQWGEIAVRRRAVWFKTKDLGRVDADGYYWHGGRADDVIISAGWTIGAVEVEDALLRHPAVLEAGVIGTPDRLRGLVVTAYVVTNRPGDAALVRELQDFVRTRLAQHEYPRRVVFVTELPRTPAGKVNRKILREQDAAMRQDPP